MASEQPTTSGTASVAPPSSSGMVFFRCPRCNKQGATFACPNCNSVDKFHLEEGGARCHCEHLVGWAQCSCGAQVAPKFFYRDASLETKARSQLAKKPSLIVIIGGGFIGLCVVAAIVGSMVGGNEKKTASGPQLPAAPATAQPAPPPPSPRLVKPPSLAGLAEFIAKRDPSITYAHLKKNANAYVGQVVWMRGQILTITEQAGLTQIQLNTSNKGYGIWTDQVIVGYAGTTPFVEKNIIRIAGQVAGNHTYTSQAGWEITAPLIRAEYVVPGGEDFLSYLDLGKRVVAKKGQGKAWDCFLDGVDVSIDPQTLKGDPARTDLYTERCLTELSPDEIRSSCEPSEKLQRTCARVFAGIVDAGSLRADCKGYGLRISKECCKRGLCQETAAAPGPVAAPQRPAGPKAPPKRVAGPGSTVGTQEQKAEPVAAPPTKVETTPQPEPRAEPKADPPPEPEAKKPEKQKSNWME